MSKIKIHNNTLLLSLLICIIILSQKVSAEKFCKDLRKTFKYANYSECNIKNNQVNQTDVKCCCLRDGSRLFVSVDKKRLVMQSKTDLSMFDKRQTNGDVIATNYCFPVTDYVFEIPLQDADKDLYIPKDQKREPLIMRGNLTNDNNLGQKKILDNINANIVQFSQLGYEVQERKVKLILERYIPMPKQIEDYITIQFKDSPECWISFATGYDDNYKEPDCKDVYNE